MTKNTLRMYVIQCRDANHAAKCKENPDWLKYAGPSWMTDPERGWTHLYSAIYQSTKEKPLAKRKALLSQEWFGGYLKALGHDVELRVVNMTSKVCDHFRFQHCDQKPGKSVRLSAKYQTIPVPGIPRDVDTHAPLGTCAHQYPQIHTPHRWAKDATKRTQWLDSPQAHQE